MSELYLNHPTFGLLYALCQINEGEAIFTTLYAQRLFFRVYFKTPDPNADPSAVEELVFDPISRNEARQILEEQMRLLRRANCKDKLEHLQLIYKRTFSQPL
ncbi:PipX family protein [Synechococcus sp. H65.1]|uniref:PipX family protein n=1 Tax=unclassified Synechococcus TaxID=2626047 RepID=UPI0039C43A9B